MSGTVVSCNDFNRFSPMTPDFTFIQCESYSNNLTQNRESRTHIGVIHANSNAGDDEDEGQGYQKF